MDKYIDYLHPIGRILLVNIFFLDGIHKISNYDGVTGWMAVYGVPEISLPFVITFEIVGAVAIAIGWRVKLFSIIFFVFCILTALIFHNDFSNGMEKIIFMKNISMAGGFLIIFLNGGGAFCLDNLKRDQELTPTTVEDNVP